TGSPDLPGQAIPGYQIVRRLGEGAMGAVYLAHRETDGTTVAIKLIQPAVQTEDLAVQRFLREASILQQIRHPHIVSLLDQGEVSELPYFVMELVDGPNLNALRQQHTGPFPVDRAVRLICQVLEALASAHQGGFIHRDIKPANILVSQRDGRDWVK